MSGVQNPHPGWYPVPELPDTERFWDGRQWTDHVRSSLRLDDYLGPIEPVLLAILQNPSPELAQRNARSSAAGRPETAAPAQSTSRT